MGRPVGIAFAQGEVKTEKRPLIVLDETSSRIVEVSVGDRIEVRLKASLGAGYSWSVENLTGDSTEYLGTRIEQANAKQSGVGGQIGLQVFSFQANSVGSTELGFVYRQPWLRSSESDRRLSFTVNTRDRK
jgi:predicted secreted protein